MKPGLQQGDTEELEVMVTQSMLAQFGDQLVHSLYSTSSLVHHMEWCARKLIVPYLEPHEEAMGSHVEVSHLAMSLPHSRVKIKATLTEVRDRKIVCDVEAYNSRGKLARGTITQALVEKTWLDKKVKELAIINQLSGQMEPAALAKNPSYSK